MADKDALAQSPSLFLQPLPFGISPAKADFSATGAFALPLTTRATVLWELPLVVTLFRPGHLFSLAVCMGQTVCHNALHLHCTARLVQMLGNLFASGST